MAKKELEGLFCEKVGMELSRFKKKVLKQGPEEIYGRAYQIDCMACIYEQLLEMCPGIAEGELRRMLVFPNLLGFLYSRWLEMEDSFTEELQDCLKESIKELQGAYRAAKEEAA